MKLGQPREDRDRHDLDRQPRARHRARRRRPSARPGDRDLRARKARARRRSRCTPSPRRRRSAAPPRSSMPSMRSTRPMPRSLGVDIDELIVSQPDTGEQALEIVDTLVRSNAIDVLVIDSVAALVPRAEIEGEMGDSHVGLQARLMSQALRKLTGSISRSRCTVIFINQLRMKIGVMYGNPETTTGGNALKFYASRPARHPPHRPDQGPRRYRRQHHPREGRQEQGRAAVQAGRIRHHVRRGRVARSARSSTSASRPGWSRNRAPGSAMTAIRIGQGRENAKVYLKENPDVAQRIENAIRGTHRGSRRGADGRRPDDDEIDE